MSPCGRIRHPRIRGRGRISIDVDNRELARRLLRGKSPDISGLPQENGRALFESVVLPSPRVLSTQELAGYEVRQTSGFPTVNRVRWERLHFRNCDLRQLKVFGGRIVDCLFEGCDLSETGFWNTTLKNVRFDRCDLREAALGGINYAFPRPNRFLGVEFDECDLRGSAHSCERYIGCRFDGCRYGDIEFDGAIFEDCTFVGNLDDAMFRNRATMVRFARTNQLRRCDFRGAQLAYVCFLNVQLDGTLLPDDPDILVLPRGAQDLRMWRSKLANSGHERYLSFVDDLIKRAGKPSFLSISLHADGFTDEEFRWLVEIARS